MPDLLKNPRQVGRFRPSVPVRRVISQLRPAVLSMGLPLAKGGMPVSSGGMPMVDTHGCDCCDGAPAPLCGDVWGLGVAVSYTLTMATWTQGNQIGAPFGTCIAASSPPGGDVLEPALDQHDFYEWVSVLYGGEVRLFCVPATATVDYPGLGAGPYWYVEIQNGTAVSHYRRDGLAVAGHTSPVGTYASISSEPCNIPATVAVTL